MLINYKELCYKDIEVTWVGDCVEGGNGELDWKGAERTPWKRLNYIRIILEKHLGVHPIKLEEGKKPTWKRRLFTQLIIQTSSLATKRLQIIKLNS